MGPAMDLICDRSNYSREKPGPMKPTQERDHSQNTARNHHRGEIPLPKIRLRKETGLEVMLDVRLDDPLPNEWPFAPSVGVLQPMQDA